LNMEIIELECLSIDELTALVKSAEQLLQRLKSESQRSLHSDLNRLARQAGLSADDMAALFN
jgi:hypothetical protein